MATRVATLVQSIDDLLGEADQAHRANSMRSHLAAVAKLQEAAAVADLIGCAEGGFFRVEAGALLTNSLFFLCDMAAAARAACSTLRAARASGSPSALVKALCACGTMAKHAPGEMAGAERESREQERIGGSPHHGIQDLSQEGRISLPTTPAALSRLGIAYHEAAVATCDAAIAAVRGGSAAADELYTPSLRMQAEARGGLGASLIVLAGEQKRGFELLRKAVSELRQVVQTAAPGFEAVEAKRALATKLSNMGSMLHSYGSDGMAAVACLHEALELSEATADAQTTQAVLSNLVNVSGERGQTVEAEALRSRLNQLYAQTGRNPETSCTICLEDLAPLAQPGDEEVDRTSDSSVRVLRCAHQFHHGCLETWWRTRSDMACPLCKASSRAAVVG